MKKRKDINNLVSKLLKETLEDKAESLTSKIKSSINELGGMDDNHPVFGNLNFSEMNPNDFRRLLQKHKGEEPDEEEEEEEYNDEESSNLETMYGDDYDEDDLEDDWSDELQEGFDDEDIKGFRKGMDFNKREFRKEVPIGKDKIDYSSLEDDSTEPEQFLYNQIKKMKRKFGDDFNEMSENVTDEEKDVCEQCGSGLTEGECNECGYKMESEIEESIYDVDDMDGSEEFDYVQEELGGSEESCKYHRENFGPDDERTMKVCQGLKESLKGNQRILDKNKNKKIDKEDLRLIRKGKRKETKEGKKFPDLSGDGKVTKKDVLMGRGVKLGKVKESLQFTENELIDLIEKIVNEQKSNIKSIGKVRGLESYEKAHKGSGKENKEYMSSVTKKMKDYLKDGSKGEYSMEPKHFPKGNGELEKMSTKKYTMSNDGKEFIDDFMRPGMENLDYDEIHPNEEWVSDNIEGSSKTGNNPKWANAEETELGGKINKKRKENKLAKAKRQAYNKSAQPVVKDTTGEDSGKGVNIKLESTDKQTKILNEEFDKIQRLMGYNRKTQ